MLKELRIFNIILIETSEVVFQEGLNVITGETGSGKSAIIHALSFITGARADTGMIRKGAEKAAVEAVFEVGVHPILEQILENAGIDQEKDADLILRRELTVNGKGRAFINNQMVQISLLRTVGELLVTSVGQHANQKLLLKDYQRQIIDLFGDLEEETANFAASWAEENRLGKQLDDLVNSESQRLRDIEACLRELEELENASVKEGEDEEAFAEYSLLANSEEIAQKTHTLLQGLTEDHFSVIQRLSQQKNTLDELAHLDPSLADTSKSFHNAIIELQEVVYTLSTYQNHIDCNPERSSQLNERLTLITTLKRKYGPTIPEIHGYQKQLKEKLNLLDNAETQIEELKTAQQEVSRKNNEWAIQLTTKRKSTAKKLEKTIIKQLQSLNMPKVDFEIQILAQKRSRSGDDAIEFLLIPNVGENKIPIKDCASGGEISRILLAIHTVLAGKEKTQTLIFDEIDANIGGETALSVGEKLKEIGREQQVLCITHFHQVAKQATHHLQISKSEKEGRTVTQIETLNDKTRHLELSRMLGGA